jgi:hypothetical protein
MRLPPSRGVFVVMTDAPEFTVLFQWPEAVAVEEDPCHALDAQTLQQAQMQAAMLYAGAAFKTTPPTGYRILHRGAEAYRYPPAEVARDQMAA